MTNVIGYYEVGRSTAADSLGDDSDNYSFKCILLNWLSTGDFYCKLENILDVRLQYRNICRTDKIISGRARKLGSQLHKDSAFKILNECFVFK